MRSAGFFVYQPDESGAGLRLCSSDWAQQLPRFGHRVDRELAANRLTWMSEEGKPALCDWTRTRNKKRQTGDKELEEEEEQQEAASLGLHTGFESAGPLSLSVLTKIKRQSKQRAPNGSWCCMRVARQVMTCSQMQQSGWSCHQN